MSELNDFQKRIGVGEPSRIVLRRQGTTKSTTVIHEEGRARGSVGGKLVEHWDGRVDAVAAPQPVRATASRSTGKIVDVS
jgi:hypothetical protein